MSKHRGVDSTLEEIQNLPFEEALKRLETIVESMEAQDLPLETLLARYQEGTSLAQLCQARLNEADLKIQQLEKNTKGELVLKPAQIPEEKQ
jgi:exodeoxyribonuclease VII small subunit